jgi:hypothetical protein
MIQIKGAHLDYTGVNIESACAGGIVKPTKGHMVVTKSTKTLLRVCWMQAELGRRQFLEEKHAKGKRQLEGKTTRVHAWNT